jgi:site-specific recombinase XerD
LAGEWATTKQPGLLTRSFTEQLPAIQAVILHLERKGKAPTTRITYEKALLELAKRANLQNTQDVELAISRYKIQDLKTRQATDKPASNRWKSQLCTAYMHYCKYHKIIWEMPTYNVDQKGIEIPTNAQCAMFLARAHGALSMKIDISTQTGLRPIEIQGDKGLKVKDIHADKHTITAINTKGCNARPPMPITEQLTTKLQTYITKHSLQSEDTLFSGKARNYGDHFRRMRNRLAKDLADPSINSIKLYHLRHYYITNKLRKIQNAEIVRQLVGHKRLNTTQKYFHLLAGTNAEWIVEGTTDKKRAQELLEADFTYQLTTPDGTMLFRKPK